jgi:hypothetical protein
MICDGSLCGASTVASADPPDVAVARESASDTVSAIAATAHTAKKFACLTGIALLLTRVKGEALPGSRSDNSPGSAGSVRAFRLGRSRFPSLAWIFKHKRKQHSIEL